MKNELSLFNNWNESFSEFILSKNSNFIEKQSVILIVFYISTQN